jgi:glycosyltransferase 2 family protein
VTPGHIGEVFKLHLNRERSGVPVVQTAPILVLDRLTEGGGFAILALASALMLPALAGRVPSSAWLLPGLAIVIVLVASRRWDARLGPRLMQALPPPIEQRLAPLLRQLWVGWQASLSPRQILGGLILSVSARFADGLVVLFVARLYGVHLALFEAVFVLAVSGLAGGISFLPGGTGAVEATMVALLVLIGAPWSSALAITLLARLSTLWLWVALGLVLAFLSRVPRINTYLGGSKRY